MYMHCFLGKFILHVLINLDKLHQYHFSYYNYLHNALHVKLQIFICMLCLCNLSASLVREKKILYTVSQLVRRDILISCFFNRCVQYNDSHGLIVLLNCNSFGMVLNTWTPDNVTWIWLPFNKELASLRISHDTTKFINPVFSVL